MQRLTDEQIRSMFWLDEPEQWGWRGLSLLIPSIVTALGLFAFAVLAFSFTELHQLPDTFRRWLVVVGAFTLAAGGEVGTVFGVIEVYRKEARNAWDWSALVVSCCATFGAFLLAFAALLGVNATWSAGVRAWGPIAQGVLVALDGYGLFVELGLYLSSYDARVRKWRAEYTQFKREMLQGVYAHQHSTPAQDIGVTQHTSTPAQHTSTSNNGRLVCPHCGATHNTRGAPFTDIGLKRHITRCTRVMEEVTQ